MTNTAITEKTTDAMTDIAAITDTITENTITDIPSTDNPSIDAANKPTRRTTRVKTNLSAPRALHGIP